MMSDNELDLISPGEILLEEFLKPLGVSQNRLARDIDVNPGRVADIVQGRRGITADTALRLAKFFGTTPQFWMNLQSDHDLRRARRETWPVTEPRVRVREAASA
jgi:addiction module HigA family antidote